MIHAGRTLFLFEFKQFGSAMFNKKILPRAFKISSRFSTEKTPPNQKNSQSSSIDKGVNSEKVANPSLSNETPNINSEQIKFTTEEQNLIKNYEPDEFFNFLLNVDQKHNFQKDLIIAKKLYNKSTQQLRASILFQDLLKTETQIAIYDTKGKPYFHMWMRNIFNVFILGSVIWIFHFMGKKDPKLKILHERTSAGKLITYVIYGLSFWFMVADFYRFLKFQRRFVQKIVYDTKTQNFLFTKRNFFGGKKVKQISRFKLVYTQNSWLNKKGTNYFNLETKEQYSIPYKQSWIRQDLFSHLISQRIKI